MDPQTLLDSTFFLIPSFVPKKGLDPQVSICEISLSELSYIDRIINICSPKVSLLSILFNFGAKIVAI